MSPSELFRRPPVFAVAALLAALLAAFAPSVAHTTEFGALAFAALCACSASLALRGAAWLAPAEDVDLRAAAALLLVVCIPALAATELGFVAKLDLPWLLALIGGLELALARRPRESWVRVALARALAQRPPFAVGASFALFAAVWALEASKALRYTAQESDAMWYHLPFVAEWIGAGAITVPDSIPLVARAYPGLRQAALAALSLPMRTEHLALLGLVELPLLLFATHFAARRAGAARASAAAIACYVATSWVVLLASRSQGTDLLLGAAFVLSFALVRDVFASGDPRRGILAGIALGALCAAKYSGPFYAALIVAACAVEALVARRRAAPLRALVCAVLSAFALAGPWYARNWIEFANPLYPAPFLFFDGPLDAAQLADKTVGWNLPLLLRGWRYFHRAHGLLFPLLTLAPLVLLALVAARRKKLGDVLALVLLLVGTFVAFLHQPFNVPSHEPYYNMRYLIGWAALLAVAHGAWGGSARWAPLFLAAAAYTLWRMSPYAPWLLAGACAAAFLPHAHGLVRAAQRLASATPNAALASCTLLAIAAFAWRVESWRAQWQYEPGFGYRDSSSERGWGELAAWAHRELRGVSIGVHGDSRTFPFFGEHFENRVVALAGDASLAELAAAATAAKLDYLVCLAQPIERESARRFTFAPSLAPALLAEFPTRFELVRASRDSHLLRVRR
jgi:hypothetical protein